MSDLAIQFGLAVQRARKEKGISQEAFAALCGFDRSYMSRIERGVNHITLTKVYVIAVTLGVSVEALLPSVDQVTDLPLPKE